VKLLLERAEVVGGTNAVFGQQATGVDEIEGYYLPGEIVEVNGALLLVGEAKSGTLDRPRECEPDREGLRRGPRDDGL